MTELKKTIDRLIKLHGGANVTSVMVCKHTGRNHADISTELGVKLNDYLDALDYQVYLSDEPKRMRDSDRKKQYFEAGLIVCKEMTYDEISAQAVSGVMPVGPGLFWNYFDDVADYKSQLAKYAKCQGVEIC